jgi:hypothetical protein
MDSAQSSTEPGSEPSHPLYLAFCFLLLLVGLAGGVGV